eukprot:IDg568t1
MAAFVGAFGTRAAIFRIGWASQSACGLRTKNVQIRSYERAHGVRMMCVASDAPDSVMETVKRKLSDALSPHRLTVTPTYGDPNGSHVSIEVISNAFE